MLTLSLNPDVQLHEGAVAQITSLGMLGDKYIEILPGDFNLPLLASRGRPRWRHHPQL